MPNIEDPGSCGTGHFQIIGAPVGGVAIHKAGDIDLPPDSPVDYDMRKLPALMHRG